MTPDGHEDDEDGAVHQPLPQHQVVGVLTVAGGLQLIALEQAHWMLEFRFQPRADGALPHPLGRGADGGQDGAFRLARGAACGAEWRRVPRHLEHVELDVRQPALGGVQSAEVLQLGVVTKPAHAGQQWLAPFLGRHMARVAQPWVLPRQQMRCRRPCRRC